MKRNRKRRNTYSENYTRNSFLILFIVMIVSLIIAGFCAAWMIRRTEDTLRRTDYIMEIEVDRYDR